MHLRLSLPPRTDSPDKDIITRPADLERWVARLPMLNVAETAPLLARQLMGLNRLPLEDKPRLRLLEVLRAPVQHVARELAKGYVGLPLPLPDKARMVAAQVRQLATEMAYGYKLIGVNSTVAAREQVDRGMLAVALQRAIRYLTELLFRSYELYSPPPEGTWLEIHQLYRYSELLGITETPLDDPLNDALKQVSIGHAYKQALLLDFADPYHLPARLLARIYRYLDRFAALATLAPGVAALKSQCEFLIDLDDDRAGVVNTDAATIATEVHYRLLTTKELARVIHQQLQALKAGRTPNPDGLEADFYAHLGHDMLVRLIQAWGLHPKRLFTRSLRENRKTEVTFGIEAIQFFSNSSEPFQPSTGEVGPQPRRTAIAAAAGPPGTVRLAGHTGSSIWQLIDESAGGYSLAKPGTDGDAVRVGDLLASRPGASLGPWEIGVVRWVRATDPDGDLELGVQRVSPIAAPAAILPVDNDNGKFTPALVLAEVTAMKQPTTVVAPRGMFKPERVLDLDNGYRSRRIRALRLVEYSGAFERFEFETIGG